MPIVLAASVEHADVLLTLFIIVASAKLMAEIFERLRQPAVVGEILAGVLIGPSVLGWVQPTEMIGTLAEIGVIFLLFMVGLETKPKDIFKVGKRAGPGRNLGCHSPLRRRLFDRFRLGWLVRRIDVHRRGSSFATSVGITARVLGSMGSPRS
jgi:hypothetical protein